MFLFLESTNVELEIHVLGCKVVIKPSRVRTRSPTLLDKITDIILMHTRHRWKISESVWSVDESGEMKRCWSVTFRDTFGGRRQRARQMTVTLCDKKVKRWYNPPLASRYTIFPVVNLNTGCNSIKYECSKVSKLTEEKRWSNKSFFLKSEKVVRW